MVEHHSNLNQRIAKRIHEQRAAQALSLDGLAEKSGVSRSMISLIERGEASPTAVVLEKLARGLNVTLASLFDPPTTVDGVPLEPVAKHEDQPVWQDPESGYLRRNVSPSWVPQPMQIVEVEFPAGQRVAFDAGMRDENVYQQIWIMEGVMEITIGEKRYRLRERDCLAMQLGQPTMFHNPSKKPSRYAVVISRVSSWKKL
jgi:transcriptional regulator with XRE-family HTH domain